MVSKISSLTHDKAVRLLWVRHAPVDLPLDKPWPVYGALDLPLAPLAQFAQQLKNLASYIVRHYGGLHGVWTSDQQRAIHTWQLLHHTGVTLLKGNDTHNRVLPHLREQNFGAMEGLTLEQYAALDPVRAEALGIDWINNKADGGESYADLHQRVGLGIQQILDHIATMPLATLHRHTERPHNPNHTRNTEPTSKPAATVASMSPSIPTFMIVSHGGVMRSMLSHVLGVPMTHLVHLEVRNLGMCVFTIQAAQAVSPKSAPPALKYFPMAGDDHEATWFWRMIHWNLTPEEIHE